MLAFAVLGGAGAAERRVLRVSMYPYIPEAAAAALFLKQGFEHDHPDVDVEISLNANYYSADPRDKGVLFEDADVHEIDNIFLRDFTARHRLRPLSQNLAASLGKLVPLAAEAATVDGRLIAAPHWLCSDFLIYSAGGPDLSAAHTLAALEALLVPSKGLLMDMKGLPTLGELYLSSALARGGTLPATAAPDHAIVARLQRFLALEPPGFGRSLDYDARGVFYARQFARRAGSAFVGYSEMTREVLDETAISCRHEDRCVTAADLRVAAVPFADTGIRPAVWADMFAIDAKVHGAAVADAEDFIRFAMTRAAYRALLIPSPAASPRYLLPALDDLYADPDILRAAPLYPVFRHILDQGAVVSAPNLNQTLQQIAAHVDASLPATH